MHPSVADAFVKFSSPLEGVVPSLYADVKGLLTVGIGCLVDPISLALPLPWVMPDGSRASQSEIAAQWASVKGQADRLSRLHWRYAQAFATMRLTDEGVLTLAKQRLAANEAILRKHFPAWDSFPADAQLCCCSMAWAVGAGFPVTFTNFTRLMNAGDYKGAIEACDIRTEGNQGVAPRNAANKLCLGNAWKASQLGLATDNLYWPGVPPASGDPEWTLAAMASEALAKHQADNGAASAGAEVANYHAAADREADNA